jgi:hypothetical protein
MKNILRSTYHIVLAAILLFLGFVVIPASFMYAQDSLTSGGSGNFCGNGDEGCSVCSSGYSQGDYSYNQGSYYNQGTYYSQPTYYLQGGYWPPINDVSLTVTPKVVRIGEEATIVWNGGNASACTVTGAGINSTAITGSQVVTVSGEAVIEIQCNLGPNISRASSTIKVLPRIQES